jgi:uncharacterized protein (DUF1697 family)
MRWVALLRAVNLGTRNKVPMPKLRSLLAEAGYGHVRTYIASGNVLLDGPRSGTTVARELERIVADEFGVDTTVIVRKPAELAALVGEHPFGRDTSRSHVVFLAGRPTARGPNGSPLRTTRRIEEPSQARTSTCSTARVCGTHASRPRGSSECSA